MHSALTTVRKMILAIVFLAVTLLPKEGRTEEKPVDSLASCAIKVDSM